MWISWGYITTTNFMWYFADGRLVLETERGFPKLSDMLVKGHSGKMDYLLVVNRLPWKITSLKTGKSSKFNRQFHTISKLLNCQRVTTKDQGYISCLVSDYIRLIMQDQWDIFKSDHLMHVAQVPMTATFRAVCLCKNPAWTPILMDYTWL